MASLGRYERNTNIWPGFVDALATLLMVIIFLLMIFVLAQFFLGQALSGRDSALQQLESQVSELADLLALEKRANTNLSENLAQMSEQLQASVADRDDLRATVNALRANADDAQAKMDNLFQQILTDKDTLQRQSLELAELGQDVDALRALRTELESEVSNLATRAALLKSIVEKEKEARSKVETRLSATVSKLTATASDLEGTKDTLQVTIEELEATQRAHLLSQAELDAAAKANQKTVAELMAARLARGKTRAELAAARQAGEKTLAELAAAKQSDQRTKSELEAARLSHQKTQTKLATAKQAQDSSQSVLDQIRRTLLQEKDLSKSARAQLALLNQQMSALRRQLANLERALEVSEKLTTEQKAQIFNLGKRLNAALASKVQELSRYRSEFFGRLRDVLGRQKGVRVVGDRFVFQSEVLFDKGSAGIGAAGRDQLTALASTLKNIAAKIPDGIDWVLRVDGHTDSDPIKTLRFPSNWELSSARAIAVVRELVANGLPPNRLVAAGFGEFQPIDSKIDEIAKRRNRRIELKLTQR